MPHDRPTLVIVLPIAPAGQSMLSKDLAFALRTLRKTPAFTVTAVLTIALGIGASTAIFSVVNAVLLRPLPYAHPERLALIQTDMRARHVVNFPIAPGDMPDLKARATAFESIAAISSGPAPFIGDDAKPTQVIGAVVTPNFFTTLGARIAFGRNFVPSDETPGPPQFTPDGDPIPNAPPPLPVMMVLSHGFWQRQFGGDSSVIGKTVQINGAPATIVGVAEPNLHMVFQTGTGDIGEPDTYTALRIDYSTASRLNVFLRVFGRLKPGASIATAQAQLDVLGAELQNMLPILKASNTVWRAEPMATDIVKDVRPVILMLMGAVLFVLLIACANVANLLLVRASVRERELAVRSALGGSRGALIGQMLAESLVLAVGGAVLGLLLAKVGIDLLVSIAPSNLPRIGDVSIDPMVLAFTALSAIVAAVVFGALPAFRASRPNLAQTLRAGGRTPGLHSGRRLRQGVVIAEVALSFVLLIGAGLMIRSFVSLTRIDPGYEPNNVLTFVANNPTLRSPEEAQAFTTTLMEKLGAIPGVSGVTLASPLPLDGSDFNIRYGPLTAAGDPSQFQQATSHFIWPNYFAVMKGTLLAGRVFNGGDNVRTSTAIIVDEMVAAKMFPGVPLPQVVGKSLLVRVTTPDASPHEIVGVVRHERHNSLATPGREGIFAPNAVIGFGGRFALRTTVDPSSLASQVRQVVASANAQTPVGDLKPMSDYVDRAMAPTRFALVLIGVFGVVAAVLAAIGLYGVLATTVRQRTAEIGVRLAFGATSESIFRLIVGQGLNLSAIGVALGLVAALAFTTVMTRASLLVSVKPTDPITYVAIAALFAIIAVISCWIPARRAASLDPNVALREE